MPTKPNRAGNQQNYVPQGNGDASGEYADNSSGSNKHFTNFKKPDDETTKTFKQFQKTDDQIKPEQNNIEQEQDIKTVRKNATNSLIGKCVNPSRDNDITFGEVIETSNDEGVKILDGYLKDNDRLKIKFGSAGRNAAGRAWGYSDIDTNHDSHTIRHELGHTFDNWYGKDLPKNNRAFESSDYASVRFVDDETNKTMNETLHEELGINMYKTTFKGWKLTYQKQGIDKKEIKQASAKRINDVFTKYGDKIFDEMTGIPNSRLTLGQLKNEYKEVRLQVDAELTSSPENEEYQRLTKEMYKAEDDYRDKMFRSGAYSINYANSPEVQQLRAKREIARQKLEQLKEKTFNERFGEKKIKDFELLSKTSYLVYNKMKGVAGIVGDTFDYMGAGSSFYTTNGHGASYFNQRKESGYALEIFANMFDCYMSKDAWKKECVKEMFPKATKIFEKIYYKKGKK